MGAVEICAHNAAPEDFFAPGGKEDYAVNMTRQW
jgi:hypothetical protein